MKFCCFIAELGLRSCSSGSKSSRQLEQGGCVALTCPNSQASDPLEKSLAQSCLPRLHSSNSWHHHKGMIAPDEARRAVNSQWETHTKTHLNVDVRKVTYHSLACIFKVSRAVS